MDRGSLHLPEMMERFDAHRLSAKEKRRPFDGPAFERDLRILSKIEKPPGELGRKRLSGLWLRAALAAKKVEGDTPRVLRLLERASELDPKNEFLAEDVEILRKRLERIEARASRAVARDLEGGRR